MRVKIWDELLNSPRLKGIFGALAPHAPLPLRFRTLDLLLTNVQGTAVLTFRRLQEMTVERCRTDARSRLLVSRFRASPSPRRLRIDKARSVMKLPE